MLSFDDLHMLLQQRPSQVDPNYWIGLQVRAQRMIKEARKIGDPLGANRGWHLARVAEVRAIICKVFESFRGEKFLKAWEDLEKIENIIHWMNKNSIIEDVFYINELYISVCGLQSLFPYTVFASPEFIIKKQKCSICNKSTSPLNSCEHIPVMVYNGEMCSRIITEASIASIALVRDPVQKFSVILPEKDPHDYARLRFVIDRLKGPFSRWRLKSTKIRYSHELFADWRPESECPCHSGFPYASCCALESGVILPHDYIMFEDPIPEGLPSSLIRRRSVDGTSYEDLNLD